MKHNRRLAHSHQLLCSTSETGIKFINEKPVFSPRDEARSKLVRKKKQDAVSIWHSHVRPSLATEQPSLAYTL